MQIGHQNKLSQTDIATLEGNFKLKMLTLFHPAISSACVHETQHPGEFTVALGVSEKHRACRQAHVVQWGRDGPTGHQAEPVRASEGILGMEKAATVKTTGVNCKRAGSVFCAHCMHTKSQDTKT